MDHIEWLALMFHHKQLKPIHQRIVHAFMRAETRNADSARGRVRVSEAGRFSVGAKTRT